MRKGITLAVLLSASALALAACGGDDDAEASQEPAQAAGAAITADALPEGFEKTPTVTLNGEEWTFDDVPGHYWKVIDDRGYAVGLHFQTGEDDEMQWAQDVPEGELLYMVYAVPGHCGEGNFEEAVAAEDATIQGEVPGGFDHWHAVVGGGSEVGHWLLHVPVRDFTFAGPPDNPMEGAQIKAADPTDPGFIPVCDIR
jgi:hypothetical protein